MDEMMIKLQILVEHQAEEISDLSKELYNQQKELARIKQQFADLTEKFQSLSDGQVSADHSEEPPPPHY